MKDRTISTLQEILSYLELSNDLNEYAIENVRNKDIKRAKTHLLVLSDYLYKAYTELDNIIDNELNKKEDIV